MHGSWRQAGRGGWAAPPVSPLRLLPAQANCLRNQPQQLQFFLQGLPKTSASGGAGWGPAPRPLHFPSKGHRHLLRLIKELGHFRRRPRPRAEMLQTQSLPDCHQANIAGCSGPVVGLSGPQELPLWSSPNPENTPNTRGCSLLDQGTFDSSASGRPPRAG